MHQETLSTYNKGAAYYAKKYDEFGRRIEDIERGIALCGIEKPFVVELGCGSGRDAKEIVHRAGKYVGVDYSEAMIHLAREWVPGATFVLSDMTQFDLPKDVDVFFCFASLLHLSREEIAELLDRMHAVMSSKGVVYLSLKEGDYQRVLREDECGVREFFLYRETDLDQFLPDRWEKVYLNRYVLAGAQWLTIALKKIH